MKLDTHSGLERARKGWNEFRAQHAIHRDAYITNCENSSGNNLKNCKNVTDSFNVVNSEDCKYLYDVLDAKTCQDLNYSLYHPEVAYECISTLQMRYSAFCVASHYCTSCFYCEMCNSSSDCFGCVGLNKKKYCILNKQYTKEEYEKLRTKIIEHMKKSGEWGEFFPAERAQFAYNETVAQEYFPLKKDETEARGYTWRDKDAREYQAQTCEIPDAIADVPAMITNEILACEDCNKNYKVISQELRFYKNKNLPIPRKCDLCRHAARMQLRTPRQLGERTCGKCNKSITSAYQSGRPEQKIYCEGCYLAAIY